MRQLKGKPKENAKEKKDRKKEFAENREKAFSVGDNYLFQLPNNHSFSALPILGACFVLLVMLVYSATRPKTIPMDGM